MPKTQTYSAKQVIDAIQGSGGIISVIASRLGCVRGTVYNYINNYATVEQALADERERNIDVVESQLMRQINEGNTTAIIFYLKTQGKSRGYVERQEVDSSGELNIRVTFEDELD